MSKKPKPKKYPARTTTIEWCQHTWNPFVGCTPCSAGCDRCYAQKMAHRNANMGHEAYNGITRDWKWNGLVQRNSDDVVQKPFKILKPAKIFATSMGDFWHPNVPAELRAEALDIMSQTQRHRYLVLTKRPQLIMPTLEHMGRVLPTNVWVGATVEDHRVAGRIDAIREVPAQVRFLSIEPLIGPIGKVDLTGIDWVIVGGESGPRARPIDLNVVRNIRDQCAAAGAAFFFKQWGVPSHNPLAAVFPRLRRDGETLAQYIGRVDGHHGGSLLDGERHKEFPVDSTWV